MSAVVSNNRNEIDAVRTWLKGSDLELACLALREAEENLEKAKAALAKVKKKLGRVMAG